ncbi:ATP-binding protein [Sulfitobacter sp. S223]|uniref:sensor histidine kinase n=1 Tax=Sulfitobacter sp. S223 TaxID=2867023 RepID=UPI0022048074|nr:ATP-binding protein [Sulfitobacter sp. S223]
MQVLVNLLSNAIKFSPPGGVVTIRLAHHQSYNRISVIDRGDGIPDADQKALFGRFVQIGLKNRAATGGTGLGLSIVKAILEHQNGTISVDSTLGQGTTFHVDLPQIAPVEARAHAEGA